MPTLGVNIDHVATIRQARREQDPDPILAARLCEKSGAHAIVAHLREDRRHIQDRDILVLRKVLKVKFNLEMSMADDVVDIAVSVKPQQATIVPEKRQEVTTEGGLNVVSNARRLKKVCARLDKSKIIVSLFIAPDKKQIDATRDLGVGMVEFHTGAYAHAFAHRSGAAEFKKIADITAYACKHGIRVNAGHGLNYDNVRPIARIEGMEELNIGHSIISRAVFVGMEKAVKDMLRLVK